MKTKPTLHILVIEDSQTDVLLLDEALNRDAFNSFKLIIAERLSDGIATLRKSKFDLILLDLGLPDSQGLETFEMLHKECRDMPIVVISGLMDEKVALEAVQAGAQDYLVKGPASWEIAPRAIRYAIERKRAEESLAEMHRRLSATIAAIPDLMFEVDARGRILDYQANASNGLYEVPEVFLGKTVEEVMPPDAASVISKALSQAAIDGRHRGASYALDMPFGRRWFELSIAIKPGDSTYDPRFLTLARDITERKQAELDLFESERRYRAMFENSPIAMWVEDFSQAKSYLDSLKSQGVTDFRRYFKDHPDVVRKCAEMVRILDVNNTGVQMYKAKSREELIRQTEEELSRGESENISAVLLDITEGKTGNGWEGKDATMTGDPLEISMIWSVAPGHEENYSKVMVTTIDITAHKRVEEALRESEEKYRLLFEHAPVGVFQSTPEGRYISVNPTMASMFMYDSPERMMSQVTDIATQIHVDPTQRERFKIMLEEKGEVREFVNQNYRRDGSIIWTMTNARAVKDHLGKIQYYEGFMTDITLYKQTEEAVRVSEKKFKTLFEIAPVGISVIDRQQNIVDANYALERITGLHKKELMNGGFRNRTYLRPDGTAMRPDEFASSRALMEDMPIFDIETGIATEDRGVIWTLVSAAPLHMQDAGLVVITQDISERKLTEQTLHQRLAELETLYESGLSLSQLLEPKEIGQKIIDVLAEKLDWYHTTIRLYHPETDSLELLAYNLARKTTKREWRVMGERFKTLVAKAGDGLSGWALQQGKTVRCNDVSSDPHYVEMVPGIRSGLYVPIKTGERAIGVISVESEKPDYFTAEDEHMAVTLAAQAAVAFENIRLFKDLQKSNDDLFLAYDETIEGWSHALDLRDRETEGHTQRVTTLTEELACKMGIPDSGMIHLRRGSLLHDIGKMGVPDRILLKPDKLNEDEWIIMREHPVHAYNLLSRIEFLRPALNIPHYHHERWDGSGYPEGLKGEEIPLEARIFAVIDVFDALISDRPYRPGWPRDKAINYIREQSGSHFDPKVVEAFLEMIGRQA